jgi:hypothetical protein
MDQEPLPTADELGVTAVEYERIVRGLRQRQQDGTGAPYRGSPAQISRPVAARTRWRRALTWRRAVPLVVFLVVLVVRHGAGASGGPGYAFIDTVNGQPVTQSSCKPLRVAVYPAGGPSDAEALVREAVGILRSATGLDIVVAGVFGGYAPGWNFQEAPLLPEDPVGVSWQDSAAIKDLSGDVAGLGGSSPVTSPAGTTYLVSGTIALSKDFFAHADHADKLAVVLHEFGHVLGLDHAGSRKDVMYPVLTATKLGPGDLEGLRRAGKGPCV